MCNDTATPEIFTLSLHDALPIWAARRARHRPQRREGPRLHGLGLLHGPARAPDRARVVPLRAAGRPHARRRAARGDRKSTRLNSSHGYISYAVVCLKKKTFTTSV